MDKSVAFIRTDKDKIGFADQFGEKTFGIPYSSNNEPVISIIGSSRDGKSSLLNLLYKRLTNGNATPFEAKVSTDMVTNGINYFTIPKKFILMDCQGMALESAKHDHYLTLIIYLISNVIILNVRQQLDLQVLNNLLAVFSFLSEIPDDYKRKDKPTLIIRIKDFQDWERYDADNNYLNNYVKKWLSKSNDQFDQVKEAFAMAFNIEVIVTDYPVFTDKRKRIIDIHDKQFYASNDTFTKMCDDIIKIALQHKNPMPIMTNQEKLKELIQSLISNKKIDYKKLDLYHNIVSGELKNYVIDVIQKDQELSDRTIINNMDGTRKGFDLYYTRFNKIKTLEEFAYNEKFKDVTPQLKDEIFKKHFDEYYAITEECKQINYNRGCEIIKPYYDTYKQKYEREEKSNQFIKLMQNIMEIFDDNKIVLYSKLQDIDLLVADQIRDELEKEKKELEEKQKTIKLNNQQHQTMINSLIKKYNPDNKFLDYLIQITKEQVNNENYNINDVQTYDMVRDKIRQELVEIIEANKKIWYLNGNNEITVSDRMTYDINNYMPKNEQKSYWNIKRRLLTTKGFLRNIDPNINSGISFTKFMISNKNGLVMTTDFHNDFYNEVIKNVIKKYRILEEKTTYANQCMEYTLKLPLQWDVNENLNNVINNCVYENIIIFCTNKKINFVQYN